MSLNIHIAHTGLRLEAGLDSYHSIDELKAHIARESTVPASHQVLLTARGKLVKTLNLLSENELFVYDRDLFAIPDGPPRIASPEIPIPERYVPRDPPSTISDQDDLESWQTLFKERRQWTGRVSRQVEKMVDDVILYDAQSSVIQRATAIASERVNQNSGGLQDKYDEAKKWVRSILREPRVALDEWDDTLKRLALLPANTELLPFFNQPGNHEPIRRREKPTLQDLVDVASANNAASRASDALLWLEKQVAEIRDAHDDLTQKSRALSDEVSTDFSTISAGDVHHTVAALYEEVKTLANKIDSDCDIVLGQTGRSRTISAISKTASNHTNALLPSLLEAVADISQLLRKTVQRRNESQSLALRWLQKISVIEATFANIKSAIAGLGIDEEEDRIALDVLSYVVGLTSMYASVLIEVVRRREWVEKMMTDSSTLAEEMAVHKEDEERRRRKWTKSMELHLHPNVLESKTLGIEVNLKNQGGPWPKLTRQEIHSFTAALRSLGGFEAVLQEVAEQSKALDAPSKQQVRRANAFKHGSIHDGNYGRNSLLLRGDDEMIQVLQSDKTRLEDRLKGSESRVRKLEDLLHRQQQVSRPQSGSPRGSLDRISTSPVLNHAVLASSKGNESISRHSATSSRRVSANYGHEENMAAQKLLQLEFELASEKSRSAQTQRRVSDHQKAQEELTAQVQEAISTKKDLMENLEAQKIEFDNERRIFLEENRNLKVRLEEMEEEYDRVIESNDNTKLGVDEQVQTLEAEIVQIRKHTSEEVQKAQGLVEFVKHEHTMQREKAYGLEKQAQSHHEEKQKMNANIANLEARIRVHDEERGEHQRSLRAIFSELSESEATPEEFQALVEGAESVSRKASSHLQEVKLALESLRAENTSFESQIKDQDKELVNLKQNYSSETNAVLKLREELATSKAQLESIKTELEDERKELSSLRSKFSDGETGPEALRTRIGLEEEKNHDLTLKLAAAKPHIDALEKSLAKRTDDLESLQLLKVTDEHNLKDRAHRAEKVSLLMFSQIDRLTHLLEHIGFNVAREDDVMVIARVSRSTTANSSVIDPSQSINMNRSLSGPIPKHINATLPEYIHWALSENQENERARFETFIHESQAFDMDAFSEAIVKRIKDTEHIARKWQREAKSYREKFHKAQFDSQNKIAFRSFREGDLALFLPTRSLAPKRSWAAFNVGAPHYFLREQEIHRLSTKDYMLARIGKVEERVVDLSKSTSTGISVKPLPSYSSDPSASTSDDENPFGLSDGLRWYFLDAAEEKLGAPSTPGLGKTTVASAHVDAAGSIQRKKENDDSVVSRTLAKSLDSRRSSGNSRKSLIGAVTAPITATMAEGSAVGTGAGSSNLRRGDAALESLQQHQQHKRASPSRESIPEEEVRKMQLLGP